MGLNRSLKKTADILTSIRFVGAVIIPVIGLIQGPSAVAGPAGWLLLLFLLTDLFDGKLARKSGRADEGVFGKLDAWADLALVLGSFTLLCVTGFVSAWVYGVVILAIAVLCRVDFLIFQGIATFALVVLYFVVACIQDTIFLVGIVVFLGMHVVFSRERFVFLWNRFWEDTRKLLE